MPNKRGNATRAAVQDCALDLFSRLGFDAVTVADVVAAAGVSHMTFFRHFPTKESVLLDDLFDPIIADAVVSQPATLPALERVRLGILSAWASVPEPTEASTRARVRIVAGHPFLRARAWENNQRTEHLIVQGLTSHGVGRLEAAVAAGACLGALMAALLDWGRDDGGASLGERISDALELLGGRR